MTRYSICIYWLYICTSAFLAKYWLDWEWLIMRSVLMVFDSITWARKAVVLKWVGMEAFSSARRTGGVISKVLRLISMILFAWITGYIADSHVVTNIATNIVLWLLIVAEFISILQNIIMIHQRKHIPEWDAVSVVLWRMLRVLKKVVEDKTK